MEGLDFELEDHCHHSSWFAVRSACGFGMELPRMQHSTGIWVFGSSTQRCFHPDMKGQPQTDMQQYGHICKLLFKITSWWSMCRNTSEPHTEQTLSSWKVGLCIKPVEGEECVPIFAFFLLQCFYIKVIVWRDISLLRNNKVFSICAKFCPAGT